MATAGRAIGLHKTLENLCLGGWRDAHTAIAHAQHQCQLITVGLGKNAQLQLNLAAVGEFDGIAQQVADHLTQPQPIT